MWPDLQTAMVVTIPRSLGSDRLIKGSRHERYFFVFPDFFPGAFVDFFFACARALPATSFSEVRMSSQFGPTVRTETGPTPLIR